MLIAKQQAALSKLEAQMQAVQKRANPGPPAPRKLDNSLSKQESSYADGLTSRQRSTQKWIDKMKGRGGSGGANKSGDAPWNKVQNKGGGKGGRGR